MTDAPRPRFSVRLGKAEPEEVPYEGVPEHLLGPLQEWVWGQVSSDGQGIGPDGAALVCIRLRITVPSNTDPGRRLANADEWELLDVIDEILKMQSDGGLSGPAAWLTAFLVLGGSAYRVNDSGDGLEERIDATAREAVKAAINEAAAVPSAGSASDHLSAAWRGAYGLHPDGPKAYSEAIKAVECAAHDVIQPNNARATLGTMLGEIKNARSKFAFAIPVKAGDPVDVVEAMMRTLWDGQTARHGAKTTTTPETLESARVAVHLAATLVQWFVSGAVKRL